MSKLIYKVKNLCKTYENNGSSHKVLENLDFSLEKGKFTAIMGPSGVGKSTLLNLLGMLDSPTGGNIFFNDKDISCLNEKEKNRLRRKNIGFIFQFHHLIKELNAAENAMIPLFLQGKNRKNALQAASSLLSELGLEGKENKKPGNLSGGERQRIAIARAVIHHPEVILGDEISGNLDTKTSVETIKLLKEIQKKYSLTMVIVTHDKLIAREADITYQLQYGNISKEEVN